MTRSEILSRYRRAHDWIWAQEESQNMGGWTFMEARLRALGFACEYVGRDASSSPATGSLRVHRREQQELVAAALSEPAPYVVRAAWDGTEVREPGAAPAEPRLNSPLPVRKKG